MRNPLDTSYVTALLSTPAPATRLLPRSLACLLLACVAVSATAALDAATDLHEGIEVAQGEQGQQGHAVFGDGD